MTAEVVVVGAGVAGCIVADRLASRGLSVLLLEAGPAATDDAVAGLEALTAISAPGRVWSDENNYVRGRGLGGGSAINGLVMMAGDSDDLRLIGGDELIGEVNAAIDNLAPRPHPHGPLADAFRRAARAAGHVTSPTSALIDQQGLATAALAIVDDQRQSVADLVLADRPERLEVATGVEVIELLGSGTTVSGVRSANGDSIEARHVVLSAGALSSPRLLLAENLGNEHVGQGLRDHPSVALTARLRATPEPGRPPGTAVLRWSSGLEPNDLMTMPIEAVDDAHGLLLTAAMRSDSIGSVTSGGADFKRLSSPDDRARLRAAVRGAVALLADAAFDDVVDEISIDALGSPLSELPSDDDGLNQWMMASPDGLFHAGCSCRMGTAVSDGGQVLETKGVSVIDASTLPLLPKANPQLAIMGMASLLADQLYLAMA